MTTTMEQRNLARRHALDHGVELGERGITMVASLIGDLAAATAARLEDHAKWEADFNAMTDRCERDLAASERDRLATCIDLVNAQTDLAAANERTLVLAEECGTHREMRQRAEGERNEAQKTCAVWCKEASESRGHLERLTTIIDEGVGIRPVESTGEALTALEAGLFEQRQALERANERTRAAEAALAEAVKANDVVTDKHHRAAMAASQNYATIKRLSVELDAYAESVAARVTAARAEGERAGRERALAECRASLDFVDRSVWAGIEANLDAKAAALTASVPVVATHLAPACPHGYLVGHWCDKCPARRATSVVPAVPAATPPKETR